MWVLILVVGFLLFLYLRNNSSSSNSYSESKNYVSTKKAESGNSRSTRHYGKYFNDFSTTSLIDKNELLVKEAIQLKRKIHFKYRDREKNFTERTVTPSRLFIHTFGDDGEMLCMEAFCHLRNANRTFALFRMNSVRIA